MSVEDYQGAVLDLPPGRLKKLPSAVHPQLEALVQEMKRRSKVLYQESLLEEMIHDLVEGK